MKKRLVLALIILAVFVLSACDDYTFYDGSHPELFVIASHSLLGVSGGLWEDIMILDEDAFGRILFAYSGFTITNDPASSFNILAVLVALGNPKEIEQAAISAVPLQSAALEKSNLDVLQNEAENIMYMSGISEKKMQELALSMVPMGSSKKARDFRMR